MKTYIAPQSEELTLSTTDLMQSLGVLTGSGNSFDDPNAIEAPSRSTLNYAD